MHVQLSMLFIHAEGTGRMFFEFFYILSFVRLAGNGDRPLYRVHESTGQADHIQVLTGLFTPR